MVAGTKKQPMAEFYAQCLKKGYTDMHDETQSLKAKVIATDLKLNYGSNIAAFFEKARQCYEEQQAELAEARRRGEEEKCRAAVDGELLVTLSDQSRSDRTVMKVFIRPDSSIYTTINDGPKWEGSPSISVEKGGSLQYTYNPSETVYTGVTVGNVHTGGFHQTQASYSERVHRSGKGYVEISKGGKKFTLATVTMSDKTAYIFRRDEAYKSLVQEKQIRCYRDSEIAGHMARSALSGGGNIYMQMQTLTMAADERRLEYATCLEIADLLRRIVCGDFPPTDEALYAQAEKLAEDDRTYPLQRAIAIFESLTGYRDSAARARSLRAKYEDALQREKEQAVLERENSRRALKVTVITVAVIALVIAAVIFGLQLKNRSEICAAVAQELRGTQWQNRSDEFLSFSEDGTTCTFSYENYVKGGYENESATYTVSYSSDRLIYLKLSSPLGSWGESYKLSLHYDVDENGNVELDHIYHPDARWNKLFYIRHSYSN